MEKYAFWKYDLPPYVLGAKVIKEYDDGLVAVQGFEGCRFKPIKVVPLEEGIRMKKEIDEASEIYQNAVKTLHQNLKDTIHKVLRDDGLF